MKNIFAKTFQTIIVTILRQHDIAAWKRSRTDIRHFNSVLYELFLWSLVPSSTNLIASSSWVVCNLDVSNGCIIKKMGKQLSFSFRVFCHGTTSLLVTKNKLLGLTAQLKQIIFKKKFRNALEVHRQFIKYTVHPTCVWHASPNEIRKNKIFCKFKIKHASVWESHCP